MAAGSFEGAVQASGPPAATPGRSLASRAGPLVLARLVSACLTVTIPLVLARSMPLGDFGTYKQLFLLAQTLYFVLPFGVPQSLYFFIPRSDEKRTFLGQTLVFLVVVGLVAAGALWALGPSLADALNNRELIAFRADLALYVGLTIAAFSLELSLTCQGKTRAAAAVYLVSDSARAAAMTVPVLLGFGLHGMMWTMCALSALRVVAAWALLPSGGPLGSWGLFVRQARYAAPFGAAILFSVPQQYAHQFAVSSYVGPALFAIYAAGCFNVPIVDLLYSPTSEVLMVRLGELDRAGRPEEGLAAFREATAKLAYAFFPAAALLWAAAPELIMTLFGPRFAAAAPIFRVCLVGIPLASLPIDGALRARNQTKHIFLSYVIKALATVPAVYLGVHHFGIMGGASAYAFAEVLGKAVLLSKVPAALSTPRRRIGLRQLIPLRDWGRAALAGLAGMGCVFVVRLASSYLAGGGSSAHRVVPIALCAGLFGAGYAAWLWRKGWLASPREPPAENAENQ